MLKLPLVLRVSGGVFSSGKILSNLDLKNMIFDLCKRSFHGKNGPNLPDLEKRISRLFYDKFQ